MSESDAALKTKLRIPGNWSHPRELLARMPTGYRLTGEALILPDRTEIEFAPLPPDDQFPRIFRSACRRPASLDELRIVDSYTVNVGLIGPSGSLEAALAMMQAGAAIVRAGGAGVFIDNSALAHGGSSWIELTEDGGPDALSFAFVSIIRGRQEMWTMGMHVMGLPDILMRRADVDSDEIIEVIQYLCRGDHPVADGHILADEDGPRFQVAADGDYPFAAGSPMYNPFGRLRLVSMRDIAENN